MEGIARKVRKMAHIGVDKNTGLVHHLKTTAANEHDVTVAAELLYDKEKTVYGDSRYLGTEKRPEAILKNKKGKKTKYKINKESSMIQKLPENEQTEAKKKEHKKSSVRWKAEHVFAVVKNIFIIAEPDTDFIRRSDSVCLCVKN